MCKRYATGCICLACRTRTHDEQKQRASCKACNGDISRCLADDVRPLYCEVFTSEGERRPARPEAPRQPWELAA